MRLRIERRWHPTSAPGDPFPLELVAIELTPAEHRLATAAPRELAERAAAEQLSANGYVHAPPH